MKTVSIRDLRQKWPAIERGLKGSEGLLVTRDSKPVARLLPLENAAKGGRPQFHAKDQVQWLKKIWGTTETLPWVDAALAQDRGDE